MVYLIAGIPALISYWLSVKSGSRTVAFILMLVTCAFGAATGSPVFTGLDVAFGVIAWLVALSRIDEAKSKKAYDEHMRQEAAYRAQVEQQEAQRRAQEEEAQRLKYRSTVYPAKTFEGAPIHQPNTASSSNGALGIPRWVVILVMVGLAYWLWGSKSSGEKAAQPAPVSRPLTTPGAVTGPAGVATPMKDVKVVSTPGQTGTPTAAVPQGKPGTVTGPAGVATRVEDLKVVGSGQAHRVKSTATSVQDKEDPATAELRKCLKIKDEAAMSWCVESLK